MITHGKSRNLQFVKNTEENYGFGYNIFGRSDKSINDAQKVNHNKNLSTTYENSVL